MPRVFILGDNIDTDNIAPGGSLHLPVEEQRKHCLESIVKDFYSVAREGDIIIAGENFGTGSSREQAPILLKMIGISEVFARSFSRLFFRNAINVGLYLGKYSGECPFSNLEDVEIDMKALEIVNGTDRLKFEAPSDILMEILRSGGMVNYARDMLDKGFK
ncbi:MAG: LeuD/DmdB family oxidoreductase small subunit [Cuniculiplasma sp.]